MKIELVYGNEIPPKFEYLRGGVFINALPEKIESPKKIESEGSDLYSYYQTFTMETSEERLEKKYTILMCEVSKEYLNKTDHKFYGDYEPKVYEDLELVRTKRSEARAFVRANKEEV